MGHIDQNRELTQLREENARLVALLESHGIQWRQLQPAGPVAQEPQAAKFSTAEKVALFRRLFRGRTDVYPIRWEGKTSGKSGYSPACGNEWRAGVCEKPRIKCGDCRNRLLIPLSYDRTPINGRSLHRFSRWLHTTSNRRSCGPRVTSIRWTSPSSTKRT